MSQTTETSAAVEQTIGTDDRRLFLLDAYALIYRAYSASSVRHG